MPQARKHQLNLSNTQFYHCISRCVRRAYLCGKDTASGVSYEHRRKWVEDRIARLASVFAIKVCAYAVMNNHTHLILFVDIKQVEEWSDSEVVRRWHSLFKGTHLSRRYAQNNFTVSESLEITTFKQTVNVWRNRLRDISWFMRSLNEYIARRANEEDECTGRFWEGRFKMQALLDESALLACMVYVDLNPLRAGLSVSPEASSYTSFKKRFGKKRTKEKIAWMVSFSNEKKPARSFVIPCKEIDYIKLVHYTVNTIEGGPYKPSVNIKVLKDFSINASYWPEVTQNFEKCFHQAAGSADALSAYAKSAGLKRLVDKRSASQLVRSA